jgi:HlyD family secretion protein
LAKCNKGKRVVWPVILSAALSACALIPEENVIPPPLIPPLQITYNTLAVERGDLFDQVRSTGIVIAVEQHALRLDIGGTLIASHVRNGLDVSAGDILAEFDTEDLRRQAELLRRDVELAEMALRTAAANHAAAVRAYEELAVSTEQERRLADARWALTRDQYFVGNSISELQFLEAETNYLAAVQRLDANLRQARQRAQDDSERRRRQIELTTLEERLRDVVERQESFVLRAPIDGVVTFFRHIPLGDFVRAGETIMVISDISSYYVAIQGGGLVAREFRAGTEVFMEAHVTNHALGIRETVTFGGIVISGTPEVRHQAGVSDNTILIEAWEWPELVVLTTTVIVHFVRETRHNVVVVPQNAVFEFNNFAFVRIYQDGVTLERQVELGIRDRINVEVVNGLQEGELIVVR